MILSACGWELGLASRLEELKLNQLSIETFALGIRAVAIGGAVLFAFLHLSGKIIHW
jgi:hypothetical protein